MDALLYYFLPTCLLLFFDMVIGVSSPTNLNESLKNAEPVELVESVETQCLSQSSLEAQFEPQLQLNVFDLLNEDSRKRQEKLSKVLVSSIVGFVSNCKIICWNIFKPVSCINFTTSTDSRNVVC